MKVSNLYTGFQAISLGHLALANILDANAPPNGGIAACHAQGCEDCGKGISANDGYPHCLTYSPAKVLGQSYAAKSGHGYDVWWDSGAPNPSCKIIVRTPASTELPACGYYLTGWSHAGCHYTAIQPDSFMLQYCCGDGDCDAAVPAENIADAHFRAATGNTSVVSLRIGGFEGASGKRSVEGIGEMTWKRSDHAYARREESEAEESLGEQDSNAKCTFHPTSGKTTEGGRQLVASDTQVCNTPGGCDQTATTTVTVGESISPMISFSNLFNVVGASVGVTFMKSFAQAVSQGYTQMQGATGYMSYTPTLNCWTGTFSGCKGSDGRNIHKINPSQVFHVCNPAMRGDQVVGTFSFVYTQ